MPAAGPVLQQRTPDLWLCGRQLPRQPRQASSLPTHVPSHRSRGHGPGIGLLYAESLDGINWTKPSLNLTDWKGSKVRRVRDPATQAYDVTFVPADE